MAVSKKRKPNKKKLKVASRRGSMPSKEFRDSMRGFIIQLEDTYYNYLFEALDLVKPQVADDYEKNIKLDDLDDLYAAKSINTYCNLVTDMIRKFAENIPENTICIVDNRRISLIDFMGYDKLLRVIHKLVLIGESLLDDEFSGIARKYAKVIIEKDNVKGNAREVNGLGSALIDRYLLEIDARKSLKCGVDPVPVLCSNTSLMLRYMVNPETFSEDPQSYLLDNLKAVDESRQYWNISMEEVEEYIKLSNSEHEEVSGEPLPKEEPVQETLEEETRPRYSYIGDWKELSSLAEEQGFTKVRQKGDHGVFRHKQGLTVIIPQGRPIGRGLSYEIQKALFAKDKTGSAWYGVNFH